VFDCFYNVIAVTAHVPTVTNLLIMFNLLSHMDLGTVTKK
jgi:hypothetical protein